MPVVEALALNSNPCSAAGLSKTTEQTFSVALKVPRLKPTGFAGSGPTAVRVTVTGPPVRVMKLWTVVLTGLSVPSNVSVIGVGAGVGPVVESLQPPASAAIAHSKVPQAIRRSISSPNPMINCAVGPRAVGLGPSPDAIPVMYRPLDFQWPASV